MSVIFGSGEKITMSKVKMSQIFSVNVLVSFALQAQTTWDTQFKEEQFTFGAWFQFMKTGSKVEMSRWKGVGKQSYSLHDNQEAEQGKNGSRG